MACGKIMIVLGLAMFVLTSCSGGGGERGKHFTAYQQGTNVILLEPDVAEVFKDSESVNHALRMLLKLAGQEIKRNQTKT